MNGKSHLTTGFVPLLLLAVINFVLVKEEIGLNVRHKNHGVGQGAGTNHPRTFAVNRNLTFPADLAELIKVKDQARRAWSFTLIKFEIGYREGGAHVSFVS